MNKHIMITDEQLDHYGERFQQSAAKEFGYTFEQCLELMLK